MLATAITGSRLTLRGDGPDWLSFVRSLPEARFDRIRHCWTCLLTPAAALRIIAGGQYSGAADDLRQVAAPLMSRVDCTIPDDPLPPAIEHTRGWRHQRRACWFAQPLAGVLLALGMGAGKSKVAVDLVVNWGCQSTLILCPKSVLGVWRREFDRHAPERCDVEVLDRGTVARKTAEAIEAASFAQVTGRPLVLVINYDSAKRRPFADWSLGRAWDAVVCDESHRIKAHDSHVSKYAYRLGQRAARRVCLTGTPMGQSPLDIFGQARFIDPGLFGTSWTEFRDRYAVRGNPAIPQMVTGYCNQEELQSRLSWVTFRCKSEDVLDLPPIHHIERPFDLGAEGRRIYRSMERDLIAEVRSGVVTAANAMVKVLRLAQVTSGFLRPDDAQRIDEFDSAKLNVLAELLEDIGPDEPVVVFCRFRADLDRIAHLAADMKRNYAELSGQRRDLLTDQATMAEGVQVGGVQIASGGVGIDLTRARYAVYYSIGQSLIEYDQSIARLHRPGQTRPTHYYHLIAAGTVDATAYTALAERREIVEAILSQMRS